MKEELVYFRGIKEGIYIFIKNGDFDDIKTELKEKLEKSINFFEGSEILGIESESLSEARIAELVEIIQVEYELNVSTAILSFEEPKAKVYTGIDEGMAKFIKSTIRSGQIVQYDGNLIILGDVNPGALVEAKGNIIILGTLRGVVHAGVDGNSDAIVAAYNLQPTQLRIADSIGRRPDGKVVASSLPEVARVHQNEVLIEPYLPGKQG